MRYNDVYNIEFFNIDIYNKDILYYRKTFNDKFNMRNFFRIFINYKKKNMTI